MTAAERNAARRLLAAAAVDPVSVRCSACAARPGRRCTGADGRLWPTHPERAEAARLEGVALLLRAMLRGAERRARDCERDASAVRVVMAGGVPL